MEEKIFKCKQCGKCCQAFEVGAVGEDWAEKIGFEHMYVDVVDDFYIKRVRRDWAFSWAVDGVCKFLTEELKCSIHDRRPLVCNWWECRGTKKSRLNKAIKELKVKSENEQEQKKSA